MSLKLVKKLAIAFGLMLVMAIAVGIYFYSRVYAPNVKEDKKDYIIYINTGSDFDSLLDTLKKKDLLKNYNSFTWLAHGMKYKQNLKPGRYQLKANMSNRQLIAHLRSGAQLPINLTFSTMRTIEELVTKVAAVLEPKSSEFSTYLKDENNLNKLGYNRYNLISLFIPNTYEFLWNTSVEQFVERMQKEHDRFWEKNNRMDKIKAQNLTPAEAYTLASIVEKESINDGEKPRIAGVYLNRLKQNIKLQADPTVVFATGNFNLNRILYQHLSIDSPYNTYLHEGLPPGPICMPSVASLEAVINAENHDYLFFCARPDNSGLHAFAKTLSGHNENARRFHAWLNKNDIK